MTDTFGCQSTLTVGKNAYRIYRLQALEKRGLNVSRLPYALRILLENLLRLQDGMNVTPQHVEALARWQAKAAPTREIPFTPARVLLQDFTGVPAVADLAAMRDAMKRMGSDPRRINPQLPAELVIDHSVQVDVFASQQAFAANVQREYQRNRERYAFLRWGQKAFDNFKVVPPGTGICHQVNLEYLARVVMTADGADGPTAYPDTLVGTDSHTTMINGLGVLGWGVGGIEAEAAMLGEAITMLIPQVVGFRLYGQLAEGATATDLVLRVTQMLREKGVVGKFVEYFGEGLANLPLADRATIANMSPEYGATCGIFPVDAETLAYLKFTSRPPERVALVEAYMKEQGLFHSADSPAAEYSDVLELDMGTVEPSLAGPRRPQDRVSLREMPQSFRASLGSLVQTAKKPPKELAAIKDQDNEGDGAARSSPPAGADSAKIEVRDAGTEKVSVTVTIDGEKVTLRHGSVVIAAITSCTNTSNPSVMIAAGLVAKKAVERGLTTKPWVKTSLAPGSQVVTDYLDEAGLTTFLDKLRFNLVGYGCTTCIGNSGPLPPPVSQAIAAGNLVAASVLSGNRNFEGRVHAEVRANYLASPPLVVAYALAGRVDIDLHEEPLGVGKDGKPVYLRDIWPTRKEIHEAVRACVKPEMFRQRYANVYQGDETWRSLAVPEGDTYAWDPKSTYVKRPPFFEHMPPTPPPAEDMSGALALVVLGDSITTDHISPAGSFKADSPAGEYLQSLGVQPADFNSYGSRRGNHEVMMRGTFGNIRLRNLLVPGVEGGETVHLPAGKQMPIYDAAMKYQQQGTPAIVLGGKQYGSGSSRDWAAKGPCLLGVRAVIAQSFERIHRSNLVGMGLLPLEFKEGESAESLGLTGRERFDVLGLAEGLKNNFAGGREVTVRAHGDGGRVIEFRAVVRLDTPKETDYYRHGGILQYVLRKLQVG